MKTQVPAPLQDKIAALVEEYRLPIHRYLERMVRNPADAEDLTQKTFLRAYQRVGSVHDPAALPGWLYRVATNVALDHLRAVSRRKHGDLAAQVMNSAQRRIEESASRAVEQAEMSECVRRIVDDLPDAYRSVIVLRDLVGLSNAEVSQLLGCSLPTVKIRLHRARERLRVALEAACDVETDDRGVAVCAERQTHTAPRR